LIDYDHNKAVWGAPGPQVGSSEETDFWVKTVMLQYIKPHYEKFVLGAINFVAETATQF